MFTTEKIGLGMAVVCTAAVFTFACESARDVSPAAPSAAASGGFQSEPSGSSAGMSGTPVVSSARPSTTPSPTSRPEEAKVAVHGTLTADPTGVCPTITFSLNGVTVTTAIGTKYENGGCVDVKKDVRINVQGTKSGDVISATHVEIAEHDGEEDDDDAAGGGHDGHGDGHDGHGGHAAVDEARGALAELKGTCPTVTFRVGAASFSTSDKTTFTGVTCATLHNGDYVDVKDAAKDGVADSVELLVRDSKPVEVSGKVGSAFTGTCDALNRSFKVGDVVIVTNAHTRFHGLTCATIVANTQVVVMGHLQSDGSVLAMQVSAQKEKH